MTVAIRIACTAFFLMIGCQRTSDLAEPPVDETQRAAVVDAANTLRETLNSGGCQAIYDDASEFFRSQSHRRWLEACEGLRARYGTWESFTVSSAIRCEESESIVCLVGSAKFTTGDNQLKIGWLMNNGEAHLHWLDLMYGDSWIRIGPQPIPRHYDPRPRDPPAGTQS